jgi:hypothetical protein
MLTIVSLKSLENCAYEIALKILCAARTGDIVGRLWCLAFLMAAGFATSAGAQSYYMVDCSGTNPNDYTTIGSALAVAGPNSYVIVAGRCDENVSINNAWNLNLGAAYGQTATINGNVSVSASNSVFLYGLNVTNPSGDAFDISGSHNVTLWTCTANGNHGQGLSVAGLSDVTVEGPGSFDNNGGSGIGVDANSTVNVVTWGGPMDISGNHGPGVGANDGALFGYQRQPRSGGGRQRRCPVPGLRKYDHRKQYQCSGRGSAGRLWHPGSEQFHYSGCRLLWNHSDFW